MFAVMHDWTASEVQMEDPVYKWKHICSHSDGPCCNHAHSRGQSALGKRESGGRWCVRGGVQASFLLSDQYTDKQPHTEYGKIK